LDQLGGHVGARNDRIRLEWADCPRLGQGQARAVEVHQAWLAVAADQDVFRPQVAMNHAGPMCSVQPAGDALAQLQLALQRQGCRGAQHCAQRAGLRPIGDLHEQVGVLGRGIEAAQCNQVRVGADFLQRLRLSADHLLSQCQILSRQVRIVRKDSQPHLLFPAQQGVAGQVFSHVIAAGEGLYHLVVAEG